MNAKKKNYLVCGHLFLFVGIFSNTVVFNGYF